MSRTPHAKHNVSGPHGRTEARQLARQPLYIALLATGLFGSGLSWAAATPHASLIDATADSVSVAVDGQITIDVLANDTGVDTTQLFLVDPVTGASVSSYTTAEGGTLSVTVDNKVTYTPAPGTTDAYTDGFKYRVVETEWRAQTTLGNNQLNIASAGALNPPETSTATPVQLLLPNNGEISGTWISSVINQKTYFGVLARVTSLVDYDICPAGGAGTASISTSVTWSARKDTGGASTFDLAITHNNGDATDTSNANSVLRNPEAATGDAIVTGLPQGDLGTVSTAISGITPTQFDALRFGLYAPNRETGSYIWTSSGPTASITIDTTSCTLATADVNVTIAVDTDLDNDGVPNGIDIDEDNDGITDIQEGGDTLDSDGDGVPNKRDLDSDNDGLWDIGEAGGAPLDIDNNGIVDDFIDENGDGYDDDVAAVGGLANPDTDKDGFEDARDLDSDNDGLGDITESGGTDANNDGKVDDAAVTSPGVRVGGGLRVMDFDGDGIPNHADLDRDGDGITDLEEAGGRALYDSNLEGYPDAITGNGRVDRMENNNGDNLLDAVEVTAPGSDGNDANSNFVADVFDTEFVTPDGISILNADGDGYVQLDLDSSGDATDADRGDPDDNNNGFDDRFEIEGRNLLVEPIDDRATTDPDPNVGTINTGLTGAGGFGPLLVAALGGLVGLRRRRNRTH